MNLRNELIIFVYFVTVLRAHAHAQCDIIVPESDDKGFQATLDAATIDASFVDAKPSLLSSIADFDHFLAKYGFIINLCV